MNSIHSVTPKLLPLTQNHTKTKLQQKLWQQQLMPTLTRQVQGVEETQNSSFKKYSDILLVITPGEK